MIVLHERACAVCGFVFETDNPRLETCSKDCDMTHAARISEAENYLSLTTGSEDKEAAKEN